jgi:hypothetical protein
MGVLPMSWVASGAIRCVLPTPLFTCCSTEAAAAMWSLLPAGRCCPSGTLLAALLLGRTLHLCCCSCCIFRTVTNEGAG